MPADDPLDASTPVFTQQDVYIIGGFVAATFDPSLDPEDPRIVETIGEAVQRVLRDGLDL